MKDQKLAPGELTVYSGAIRVIIFGLWSAKVKAQEAYTAHNQEGYGVRSWLSLVSSNVMIAVTILLSYLAVGMIPVSDFIVFSFTAPVFSVLFDIILNR